MHQSMRNIKRTLLTLLPYNAIRLIKAARSKITLFYYLARYSLFYRIPVPKTIIIDPSSICNLRCPLCPTGSGRLNDEKKFMSFDVFKTIVDKIPGIRWMTLMHLGEPFLNPEIFNMIEYAKSRSITVSIHTNFSFRKDDDFFTRLAGSGLDLLKISLDGASRESYSKYRIGGDFDLVIANIRTLVNSKGKRKSDTPVIVWKFIVNKFNEHEIGRAQKMAGELGVDFESACMGVGDDMPDLEFDTSVDERMEAWLPKEKKFRFDHYNGKYSLLLNHGPCPHLFNSMVVNPDGKVFPCCLATDRNNVFGDLLVDSVLDVWNNEKYRFSRSLFAGKRYKGHETRTMCYQCFNYRKRK